jgi:DNA-binding NtrC family response regulator
MDWYHPAVCAALRFCRHTVCGGLCRNTLEDERLARAAGAVGYIQKPMGVDKLAEVVAQYVPNSNPNHPETAESRHTANDNLGLLPN